MTYFYPRPPRGGRPSYFSLRAIPELFLSTPSVRRATVFQNSSLQRQFVFLSTPSARRATLRKESHANYEQLFLSTPSARRATVFGVRLMILMVISIHALRKEGDSSLELAKQMTENFYPRPPQGGRPTIGSTLLSAGKFLSTPSARRATDMDRDGGRHPEISIHALREEGDTLHCLKRRTTMHFYPRPPRGGRLTLSLAWQAA